jgi:hypothetical protein
LAVQVEASGEIIKLEFLGQIFGGISSMLFYFSCIDFLFSYIFGLDAFIFELS